MNSDRYSRQRIVPEFGDTGQKILSHTHIAIVGCGGLGSHLATFLTRMGVHTLTLIDPDPVELTNLHRTALYTENDINTAKTDALTTHLHHINPTTTIHKHTTKLTATNTETLLKNCDLILDGTDNLPTRYLINETAIKHHLPWIYAGVHGVIGMIMAINPTNGPCFTCLGPLLTNPSQQTLPVLGTLPATIAAMQLTETLKILTKQPTASLIIYNLWTHQQDQLPIKQNPDCPICIHHNYLHLKK